jgi:hypothetical protein
MKSGEGAMKSDGEWWTVIERDGEQWRAMESDGE